MLVLNAFTLSPFWNTLLVNRPSGSLILLQLQLEPQTHAYHKHETDWNMNAKTPKNICYWAVLPKPHLGDKRGGFTWAVGLHWSVDAWPVFNWRCTSKMNRSCSSWNWHKKQPKITQEQEVWLNDWYDFHHLNTCNMVIFTLQVWQASFCSMVCVTLGLPRFQPKWTHFHHSQCSMEWHQSLLYAAALHVQMMQPSEQKSCIQHHCTKNFPKNVSLESGHPCWAS